MDALSRIFSPIDLGHVIFTQSSGTGMTVAVPVGVMLGWIGVNVMVAVADAVGVLVDVAVNVGGMGVFVKVAVLLGVIVGVFVAGTGVNAGGMAVESTTTFDGRATQRPSL